MTEVRKLPVITPAKTRRESAAHDFRYTVETFPVSASDSETVRALELLRRSKGPEYKHNVTPIQLLGDLKNNPNLVEGLLPDNADDAERLFRLAHAMRDLDYATTGKLIGIYFKNKGKMTEEQFSETVGKEVQDALSHQKDLESKDDKRKRKSRKTTRRTARRPLPRR